MAIVLKKQWFWHVKIISKTDVQKKFSHFYPYHFVSDFSSVFNLVLRSKDQSVNIMRRLQWTFSNISIIVPPSWRPSPDEQSWQTGSSHWRGEGPGSRACWTCPCVGPQSSLQDKGPACSLVDPTCIPWPLSEDQPFDIQMGKSGMYSRCYQRPKKSVHTGKYKWNKIPAPSVKRLHSQVHELAERQCNGLVRSSVEKRHLVHNTLGVMPVSNSKQGFQQTKLLVIRWLWVQKQTLIKYGKVQKCSMSHLEKRLLMEWNNEFLKSAGVAELSHLPLSSSAPHINLD